MTTQTTPPGRFTVLYDGHCRFCTAQMARLRRWATPDSIDKVDFQEEGALARFPGLTWDDCMKEMKLVSPDGRVHGGADAIARALTTRPVWWLLVWPFYIPGIRQIARAIYRLVARHRYRLAAKDCDGGTCSLHAGG